MEETNISPITTQTTQSNSILNLNNPPSSTSYKIIAKILNKKRHKNDPNLTILYLFVVVQDIETKDFILLIMQDKWASLLLPLIFYNDFIYLNNINWNLLLPTSPIDNSFIEALIKDFGSLNSHYAYFSDENSNLSSSQIKLIHNGFPHCPITINKNIFNQPLSSFPKWAEEAILLYSSTINSFYSFDMMIFNNLISSPSLPYTQISCIIEDIPVNIYAIVWEVITPMQHNERFIFTNVLLVDDSLTMNARNYSSSDLIRVSLQVRSSTKGYLPILTAGDIICIQNIKAIKKKDKFINLIPSENTNVLIWSGDLSSPPIIEAAHIIKGKEDYKFDEIFDKAKIIYLKNWFHNLISKNDAYTNLYVNSLLQTYKDQADSSQGYDVIAKVSKLHYKIKGNEYIPLDLLAYPTNISSLAIEIDDFTLNALSTVIIRKKFAANSFIHGWNPLKENDWLRIRSVKFSNEYNDLQLVSTYTWMPVFTRLPHWSKDVLQRNI